MRIRTVADYLALIGKRIAIQQVAGEEINGLVQDLSDAGRHLILLKDGETKQRTSIPLNRIDVIEIVDGDPALTKQLRSGVPPQHQSEPPPPPPTPGPGAR